MLSVTRRTVLLLIVVCAAQALVAGDATAAGPSLEQLQAAALRPEEAGERFMRDPRALTSFPSGSETVTNYFLSYGHPFADGGGQWLLVFLADASAGTRAAEIGNSVFTILYEGMYGRENAPESVAAPAIGTDTMRTVRRGRFGPVSHSADVITWRHGDVYVMVMHALDGAGTADAEPFAQAQERKLTSVFGSLAGPAPTPNSSPSPAPDASPEPQPTRSVGASAVAAARSHAVAPSELPLHHAPPLIARHAYPGVPPLPKTTRFLG